ncbi:MAG: hypothetical protein ACQETB_00175 [Halobacteriota archaeon]
MVDSTTAETMRKRASKRAIWLWLLVEADRRSLAAGMTLLVFGAVTLVGAARPNAFRAVVESDPIVGELFVGFLTATITTVALVVSLGQLVLSQELGAVGDQRQRMDEAMAFRRAVESYLDRPIGPADPAAFLGAMLSIVRDRATTLRSIKANEPIADNPIDSYTDELIARTETIEQSLESASFGTFAVISAALNFDYSRFLHEGRQLRAERTVTIEADEGSEGADAARANPDEGSGTANPDEGESAFEELLAVLKLFGPAREHFKTLYFQWELIELSRSIMYAAIPALLACVVVTLFVDPARVIGTTLGVDRLVWVVAVGIAVTLVPFFILLSHMFRIVTVAKQTLAIGPFILRSR